MKYRPGDHVKAKPKPGLGGWRPARIAELPTAPPAGHVAVEFGNGSPVLLPVSRVKPVAPRTKPQGQKRARTCSMCGKPGHDIRTCPGIEEFAQLTQTEGYAREIRRQGQEPRPQPKPRMVRSVLFLNHIREQPCMFCHRPGPSDPHHFGPRGLGQKTDDLRCVPVCRGCHDHFHAGGYVPPHNVLQTRMLILQRQVDQLVDWFAMLAEGGE